MAFCLLLAIGNANEMHQADYDKHIDLSSLSLKYGLDDHLTKIDDNSEV